MLCISRKYCLGADRGAKLGVNVEIIAQLSSYIDHQYFNPKKL